MPVLFGRSFAGTCKPVFFCMMEQSHFFQLPPWRLRSISITVCFPNAWADGSEENRESRRRSSAGGRYRRSLCVFFAEKGNPKMGRSKVRAGSKLHPKKPGTGKPACTRLSQSSKIYKCHYSTAKFFFSMGFANISTKFQKKNLGFIP